MKYQNLLNTIGETPVVELKRYSPNKNIKVLAKLEGTNPGGSVKDRIAYFMIKDAKKRRLIKDDTILIEPTSGNTGIGLAMISAINRYRFTAVMPESVSVERRKILAKYGADIILTDGKKGTNYAIAYARNLLKENKKYLMLDQFENHSNVLAHYLTTGKEIIRQVPTVSHFVAGMGTGGTLMGVGKRLKRFNDQIAIIGIEPKPGSKIQGLRNMDAYVPPIYDEAKLDSKMDVPDEAAFELTGDLFKKEGLSVGFSSGAALWGAMQIAKQIKAGVIVTVFPDRGDRYLSLL
ncbi:cysteine synthase family protein [Patescibacteria group bacterium]|nr:cysteine synthase family protein [Patescibacteria group bacterium]